MNKKVLMEQIESLVKDDEISQETIIRQSQEIDRLNNIIDTILDFNFFNEECPLNFGFGDKKEEKAQDVFYKDKWCEKHCNDNYKKCWLKFFDKLKELRNIKDE